MEKQEKKLMAEIKKMAQKGQHGPAKIMAKDVSRCRSQVTQFMNMSSQLTSIEMQKSSMQMNQNMMTALSGATSVMANANENMDVAQIRDTLKDFNKEMERAGMKQEMMVDAMDMMEDPGAQADADEVYNGILGEIGL